MAVTRVRNNGVMHEYIVGHSRLPSFEPARTLAALRAALRQDVNGMALNTHAVPGSALQRLFLGRLFMRGLLAGALKG